MKVCIPIDQDLGMDSPVCGHFGAAPAFLIVDTETNQCRALSNAHDHREHGRCVPIRLLQGEQIDALVVSGIGRGALGKLASLAIRVFHASGGTASDAVSALAAGTLPSATLDAACTHHHHHHHR
jgi:predicted Fe-Mo cluster-binding NifX family protein